MSAVRAETEYPHYAYEEYRHWQDRWELIDGIAYAEGRHIKAGDFHDETLAFSIGKCAGELSFDFAKIWD